MQQGYLERLIVIAALAAATKTLPALGQGQVPTQAILTTTLWHCIQCCSPACEMQDISSLRIGWSATLGYISANDPGVLAACEASLAIFRELGCTIVDLDLDLIDLGPDW